MKAAHIFSLPVSQSFDCVTGHELFYFRRGREMKVWGLGTISVLLLAVVMAVVVVVVVSVVVGSEQLVVHICVYFGGTICRSVLPVANRSVCEYVRVYGWDYLRVSVCLCT